MASNTGSGDSAKRAEGAADSTADALKESAEKIWLAGLGAFERMKSEGPRMFETLVEQGRNMSARAKDAADQALRSMREANYEAGGNRWDKFQQDMQERFNKSLGSLGVTTTRQVEALSKQVADLNEQMRNMMAASARSAGRKASRASTAGARKKAATKKKAPAKRRAKAARSS
jgi:poly(hydroxyalkanoate) granule-associated protein